MYFLERVFFRAFLGVAMLWPSMGHSVVVQGATARNLTASVPAKPGSELVVQMDPGASFGFLQADTISSDGVDVNLISNTDAVNQLMLLAARDNLSITNANLNAVNQTNGAKFNVVLSSPNLAIENTKINLVQSNMALMSSLPSSDVFDQTSISSDHEIFSSSYWDNQASIESDYASGGISLSDNTIKGGGVYHLTDELSVAVQAVNAPLLKAAISEPENDPLSLSNNEDPLRLNDPNNNYVQSFINNEEEEDPSNEDDPLVVNLSPSNPPNQQLPANPVLDPPVPATPPATPPAVPPAPEPDPTPPAQASPPPNIFNLPNQIQQQNQQMQQSLAAAQAGVAAVRAQFTPPATPLAVPPVPEPDPTPPAQASPPPNIFNLSNQIQQQNQQMQQSLAAAQAGVAAVRAQFTPPATPLAVPPAPEPDPAPPQQGLPANPVLDPPVPAAPATPPAPVAPVRPAMPATPPAPVAPVRPAMPATPLAVPPAPEPDPAPPQQGLPANPVLDPPVPATPPAPVAPVEPPKQALPPAPVNPAQLVVQEQGDPLGQKVHPSMLPNAGAPPSVQIDEPAQGTGIYTGGEKLAPPPIQQAVNYNPNDKGQSIVTQSPGISNQGLVQAEKGQSVTIPGQGGQNYTNIGPPGPPSQSGSNVQASPAQSLTEVNKVSSTRPPVTITYANSGTESPDPQAPVNTIPGQGGQNYTNIGPPGPPSQSGSNVQASPAQSLTEVNKVSSTRPPVTITYANSGTESPGPQAPVNTMVRALSAHVPPTVAQFAVDTLSGSEPDTVEFSEGFKTIQSYIEQNFPHLSAEQVQSQLSQMNDVIGVAYLASTQSIGVGSGQMSHNVGSGSESVSLLDVRALNLPAAEQEFLNTYVEAQMKGVGGQSNASSSFVTQVNRYITSYTNNYLSRTAVQPVTKPASVVTKPTVTTQPTVTQTPPVVVNASPSYTYQDVRGINGVNLSVQDLNEISTIVNGVNQGEISSPDYARLYTLLTGESDYTASGAPDIYQEHVDALKTVFAEGLDYNSLSQKDMYGLQNALTFSYGQNLMSITAPQVVMPVVPEPVVPEPVVPEPVVPEPEVVEIPTQVLPVAPKPVVKVPAPKPTPKPVVTVPKDDGISYFDEIELDVESSEELGLMQEESFEDLLESFDLEGSLGEEAAASSDKDSERQKDVRAGLKSDRNGSVKGPRSILGGGLAEAFVSPSAAESSGSSEKSASERSPMMIGGGLAGAVASPSAAESSGSSEKSASERSPMMIGGGLAGAVASPSAAESSGSSEKSASERSPMMIGGGLAGAVASPSAAESSGSSEKSASERSPMMIGGGLAGAVASPSAAESSGSSEKSASERSPMMIGGGLAGAVASPSAAESSGSSEKSASERSPMMIGGGLAGAVASPSAAESSGSSEKSASERSPMMIGGGLAGAVASPSAAESSGSSEKSASERSPMMIGGGLAGAVASPSAAESSGSSEKSASERSPMMIGGGLAGAVASPSAAESSGSSEKSASERSPMMIGGGLAGAVASPSAAESSGSSEKSASERSPMMIGGGLAGAVASPSAAENRSSEQAQRSVLSRAFFDSSPRRPSYSR